MKTMDRKKQYIILCPLLVIFWLFPLIGNALTADAYFFRCAAVYLLFLVAALLCRLLPNRHAALISAPAVCAASCALLPSAVFSVLPVILLCCLLRCYREYEKGNTVTVYFESVTDLIYVYLVAAVIRLIRSGFSFVGISRKDDSAISDFCLMALVFVFFISVFIADKGQKPQKNGGSKGKKERSGRAEKRMVGVIPVRISSRTFWGLTALVLAACLLQYTNSALVPESNLHFRSGFRLLFFPWMVLLFLALETFLPDADAWKRMFRR